jgi:hypothetical protein
MVQPDQRRHVRAPVQHVVQPGELRVAEPPRGRPGNQRVEGDYRRVRILDRVVGLDRLAQPRAAPERVQQGLPVVVVAGDQVQWQRKGADDVAQRVVLIRSPMVGQVAGDDDTVGPRIECHDPSERELQTGGGLPAKRPGGDVRVTEVRDQHRHSPMIRSRACDSTEPSETRQ